MLETLEKFVAFERECCGCLAWDLRRLPGRVLRLNVLGLAADSDFFRILEGAGETG